MFKQFVFFSLSLFLCIAVGSAQTVYPDKNLPGNVPLLFAVGSITDGLSNRDFTISPTGDEIFFTLQHPKFLSSTIICIKRVNGQWQPPQVAPFSGIYRDLEASFSMDGKTLFFSSDRPLIAGGLKKDFDIWKVTRKADGSWAEPVNLGAVVNSAKNEFYPSVTKTGNLYFTVELPAGKGEEDIVLCRATTFGYAAPESLSFNTKFDEFNAYADPDERFVLFSRYGDIDDLGKGDLYISHKNSDGTWQPAKHLPAPVNSDGLDYCPYVTIDGKYLIFTSNRLNSAWKNKSQTNYKQLTDLLISPGNGWDDLYWVKFDSTW